MAVLGAQAVPSRRKDAPPPAQVPRQRVEIRKDKTNPRRFAYLILLLFAQPPGWPLLAAGSTLVIAAILFHGWAAGYLARAGYKEREKLLTVRGPYRYNRNPYYVAHLTMDFGFFCMAGLPWLYLLYFPVIFSVYRRWVVNEEPYLEHEFGEDYRRFKQEVPRWRVRLTPAQARGREQVFTWPIFKLNNELPRATAHILMLSVFACYFFLGNPFAGVDWLLRATVVGVVVVWFVLHDIFPIDVSRRHVGWLSLAAAIAIGGAVFLAVAPLWKQWSPLSAWAAIVAGSALGLVVVVAASPVSARSGGKTFTGLFPQPMSQWVAGGLALGLLSLTLGGIWIGILVPLCFWALGLAGFVALRPLPQAKLTRSLLLVLFIAFAARAVASLI